MTSLDGDLLSAVRDRLVTSNAAPEPESIGRALREIGLVVDRTVRADLTRQLEGEMTGLGPLDSLGGDPAVTDILVNAPDEVWVDRGHGLCRVEARFADEAAVRALAVRLAARAGRRLDDAAPFVDARLPGGQRLHAVVPPLAVRGTTLSIRIPGRRRFGLDDLVAAGSIDGAGRAWLRALVLSRAAFLISGGTGSGKTSVLGALLGLVPAHERIVVVEDTCELVPAHPHVVSLEARPPNLEGQGGVALQVLVRQALRMRPDRLVIGEVRGAEVVDMLSALNTGHEGGCATVHANSAAAVPERLTALALAAGMTRAGVTAQVAAGVEVVVHVARLPDGRRVVDQVGVVGAHGNALHVEPALTRDGGSLVAGPAIERLRRRLAVSAEVIP